MTHDSAPTHDEVEAAEPGCAQGWAGATHRTYLHIGLHKTGTSFLQTVLHRNRKSLAVAGVCYPAGSKDVAVGLAVRDLLDKPHFREPEGSLDDMVEAIRRSPASTAVVSTERLSSSSTPHVRALVERLAPSEVHVVVTLRDLARVLPSDWQSKVKQGRTWTFPEYAAAATERTTGHQAAHRKFWAHHDAPEIVRRWLEVIPPERVHLVTVPPSGSPPDALWQRFCAVIGVAPDRYDIIQDQKSNFSLTYSDTEFLRQINVRVGKKLERTQKHRWVTRYAANYLLRPSSAADSAKDRPVLMAEEYLWTRQRARDIVAQLRELRVDVVGDLDDLVPPPRQDLSSEPSRPAVVYPDRAAELVASLILKIADLDPGADTRRASANAAEGTDEGVVAKTGSKREKRRAKSERRRNKRRMNQDESRRRTSGQQISEAETAVRSTEPGVLSAATNSSRSPR